MGLVFFVALTGLIGLAGPGTRASYRGLILIGSLHAVADTLQHGPEIPQAGSFHSEPWSAVFSIGLVISGLILAGTAYGALRHSDQEARSTRKKAV